MTAPSPAAVYAVEGEGEDPAPSQVFLQRSSNDVEPAPLVEAPVEPVAASLSWQQQVDAHRADFGLPPLAGGT